MKKSSKKMQPQPRTGETHGMFGVKYLKHHNMRTPEWTAEDLITQYERMSNAYRQANHVAELQQEKDDTETEERYQRLKKEIKEKKEYLQLLLKGDKQRTKNTLQDFPDYSRMYKDKQSWEVREALDHKSFLMQKKLNRKNYELHVAKETLEEKMREVALLQERNRYRDVKEFKPERDTKRLLVELKDSETRARAIQKINTVYKEIIGQLDHDKLYYNPVLDALEADWNEQTDLVKQAVEMGAPAMQNVKRLGTELKHLIKTNMKEEKDRFEETGKSKLILKEHPKTVKQLVRHDSDFSMLGTRYDRDTVSMTNMKMQMEGVGATIKRVKSATLCNNAEDIFPRVELQPELNEKMLQKMGKRETIRNDFIDKTKIAKFVRETLLNDKPDLYKDEKVEEIKKWEAAIMREKEMQQVHVELTKKRGEQLMEFRTAMQHFNDVLRNVGEPDFFKDLEYPTEDLKLALLNEKLPEMPKIIETDIPKLLDCVKSRVQKLMQLHNKDQVEKMDLGKDQNDGEKTDVDEARAQFQQAMIECSSKAFQPRKASLEF